MAKYTDEQREAALAALAVNGGNFEKTARETGIAKQTLRKWRNNLPTDSPQITALKKEFADSYRQKLKQARECAIERMLELIPKEEDLHKVTGAAKVLTEISITQEVADEYSRPTYEPAAPNRQAAHQVAASEATKNTYN